MARTPSQKRYCKKRVKALTSPKVTVEEWKFLHAEKRKSGLTWLNLVYRGLGLRRVDYLNSLKNKDAVP